ncbi:hypothetical protein CKAN_02751500 [Cinnamomum micranthum f. kanehirae]|uniref:Uncharacterized protein n=1 Tax=Cinnamomum micranthum f. kanehirae TaxID=337451 RepID=A0A443Q4T8_9MAGN|nr:hypothetical protein MRB53_037473 [Persea americana]KAJ8613874.1 hypothetical protein MRB53_036831 [Persea americana]KAJ8614688.1 hypothetical protein MRB53_036554 [Persea americana]RWR98026.1 hypothetical protein CKAN_02751500 [Cinnamomum micranthum f. kanehirae]
MGVKDITTLSKSVIYTTGCLDFAKRFVCACGEQDFSPISSRMQRTLLHSVAALVFSKVQSIVGRLPLYLTYRLRGASYRVFGAADRLKSKRWRRHFLCMFWRISLTRRFFVGFRGLLTAEERGVLRDFILEK